MSGHLDILPTTPFIDMAREFALFIGRDVKFTQDFEEFIARLPAEHDRASLNLSLDGCREATDRLSDLYHLIRALSPYEAEVRALFEKLKRESSAAA